MDKLIKGLFAGAVALGGLYVLSTQGRTGHPGLEALRGWNYAHRGLHDEKLPENSMAAFRAALEASYGIELPMNIRVLFTSGWAVQPCLCSMKKAHLSGSARVK